METVHRFDNRVEDYERYRPGYPVAVASVLAARGVRPPAEVADIGAGTGKLSEVFLRAGYRVTLVEPNDAMRAVAQKSFVAPRALVRAGTAEATGLPDASVDAITAGQAFHWFEPVATRAEWRRILRPGGAVLLVWNDRRTEASRVLTDYEALLRKHCPDYTAVQLHAPPKEAVFAFLGPSAQLTSFDNEQVLDWNGLLGRVMSASYVPKSGPAHEAVVAGLRLSYEHNAVGGRVRLPYDTRVFHGLLD